ncbi:50S ribosomal protein L6 [Candidatus Saccharibacteria bacterium]|nr:50S ribosomal protein L6 [Candidatus Saccharibacteria bacterium]MCA9328380.1 50S ribosomal protein L6 [Candidatus Saccharibacteria bacterium]
MSRIGKLPISIPDGVTITVDSDAITVKGPKGELKQFTMAGVDVVVENDKVIVKRVSDEWEHRSKHGLMRTLVANMIEGVTKGFEKQLQITGVGFRVNLAGTTLKLSLGFSHEVEYKLPEGIQAKIEQLTITISGIDKQLVGQVAAEIRAFKKPEPYKGKGIAYVGERILRKSGKSGKE